MLVLDTPGSDMLVLDTPGLDTPGLDTLAWDIMALVHQPDPSVRLASGSHPELSKLLAHPGLEGDCHHQQHNSHKRAGTNPLVKKDSDNDKLQRSTPEVVVEEDGKVKPIDIIGEKVDHLAHSGLAQGRVGELQGFSVEQRTRGHPDLHAEVHHAEEVRMMRERVDRRAHDHPGGVEVGFQLAHTAARSEVLNQPSHKQRLVNPKDTLFKECEDSKKSVAGSKAPKHCLEKARACLLCIFLWGVTLF